MRSIWRLAPPGLRDRILVALLQIAETLTLRPMEEGESRADDLRIAFFPPLSIVYRVDADRRIVRIALVKLYGSGDASQ
jgi:hypothetical protein